MKILPPDSSNDWQWIEVGQPAITTVTFYGLSRARLFIESNPKSSVVNPSAKIPNRLFPNGARFSYPRTLPSFPLISRSFG